jgi:multiple sugar transport system substrate-binding protein
MLTAAEALNDPANNRFGVSLANDAGAVFTQQTFEHIALANGCEMVDDSGAVTLDTPECVEAIDFYNTLMTQYAPQGTQDVAAVRANYFAGAAAMIVWSPFILDEMAGLRDNALPACPECVDNPAFLTEVTGFVTGFQGPSGETPVQYGQVSYVGITTGADTAAAQEFLRFWFNEGYLSWLAVAAEGKFPMRTGTADNPTEFLDGWRTLEVGVDRRAPLGDFYSDAVIDTLIEGAGSFGRWGFTQGQGQLVTAVYESLTLPRLLADMLGGSLSPEDVAADAQVEVEDLQAELAAE